MDKEKMIKLLTKNVVFWDNEGEGRIAQISRDDYDQFIVLLKEQLPVSEFTKENRDFINDANRDFQANRVEGNCIEDYVRALRELGKACDRLDTETKKNCETERYPIGSMSAMYKEINQLEDKLDTFEASQEKLVDACKVGLSYINAIVCKVPRPILELQEDKDLIEAAIK